MPTTYHLEIESPDNNATIQGPTLRVSGKAWMVGPGEEPKLPVDVTVSFTGAGSTTRIGVTGSWFTSFNIGSPGSKTITATAGNLTRTHHVTVLDEVKPVLTINTPIDEQTTIEESGPFKVRVEGTANDQHSIITSVQYRVGADDYKNVDIDSGEGTNKWDWYKDIDLDLDSNTIEVIATDEHGNTSLPISRTVICIDTGPPVLTITSPEVSPHKVTWTEGGVSVEVAGTASDPTSDVKSVQWCLGDCADDGAWSGATNVSGTWSAWRFEADIRAPGLHDIHVRASDDAGNPIAHVVQINVAVLFELEDVGFAPYLEDLMAFTRRRVRQLSDPDPIEIEKSLLTSAFHQPYDQLTNVKYTSVTSKPVSQVRIAIEVLRSYLSNGTQFYCYEYCETAYRLLLANLGTSYAEIRLVRAADSETRQALANRLGIALSGLDRLFVAPDPDQLTEQKLQSLFGLMDTTQDPLTVAVYPAELLTMQLSQLHLVWLEQDQTDYYATNIKIKSPIPTIDPDIVDKSDLKSPVSGNTAYDLLESRQQWITDQRKKIRQWRKSKDTPIEGFDHVVFIFGINLQKYEQYYNDGLDIEPFLARRRLDLDAFFVLLKIRKLAETGIVLDIEWAEFYDIMVQVKKRHQFAAWTHAEIMANLSLEPGFFIQSDTRPELIPWRATWRARRQWENKLEARTKQREALIEAHQSAIDATEEVVLPLLRDALIDTIDRNGYPDIDVADWLTQRLSISYKYSGDQKLTRLEQGVETLQDILQALRTGRLYTLARLPIGTAVPRWELAVVPKKYNEYDFDKEWKWMGSYATWRGAMFAFGYPENYLLPTLRPRMIGDKEEWTKAFTALVKAVRQAWRLTPNKAEELAIQYLETLKASEDEGGDGILEDLIPDIELTSQLTKEQLRDRRDDSMEDLKPYVDPELGGLKPNTPPHLKEVYYFVPMFLAQSLQKKGKYLAALDWFQTVYAYELPPHERKIYYGLEAEEAIPTVFRRTYGWILEKGLDVFDIANDRANAMTRYTLFSIARCYLAFADAEFTRETNESIPLARRLYITALKLLELLRVPPPVAHWSFDEDEGAIASDITGNGHTATLHGAQWQAEEWRGGAISFNGFSARAEVPHAPALELGKDGADFSVTFALNLQENATGLWRVLMRKGTAESSTQRTPGIWLCPPDNRIYFRVSTKKFWNEGTTSKASVELNTWTHVAYVKQGQSLRLYINGQLDNECILKGDSIGFDAPLFIGGLPKYVGTNALFDDVRVYDRALSVDAVIALAGIDVFPRNPVVDALNLHAELNLKKLRSGRNIAGMERIRMKPAAVELMVVDGALVPPPSTHLRPTAYRYSALIDRAKQLVSIAQQIEANFFAALEKRDVEAYNLLDAHQDVQLTKETVELQDLRIQEADNQIVLMDLHKDRAQTQHDTYNTWINAGPNRYERAMLENYKDMKDERNWLAKMEAAIAIADAAVNTASALYGKDIGAALAAAALGVAAGLRAETVMDINALELEAQRNAFNANFERRKDEWRLQSALANHDINIAAQQLFQAEINKQIVEQERVIANMRAEQAEAIVEFLNNKFTNVELYEWMSDILSEVYSYFLQQATAMAQLAAGQLAFERQERPPAFIRSDYWQAPNDMASQNEEEEAPERRGITGSARLLQDIYQLDQYAFETNKRKLQLVEHFSLARLVPYEFQRFRDTGVLPFVTPMSLFDQGFPGHYLRLIKRVRLSIVGLIPPTQGVRATLRAAGVSRAVTGKEVYKVIEVRRPPESIAFTSPNNATGLFELQPENEMLLPFETMGADASWELQLPKAANRFNFDSLADVIFTMEYTALDSADYRHQVIQDMDRTFSAERAYSIKRDFPDLWYHLHHPETLIDEDSGNIHANITTMRAHLPPNLDMLRIDHVVLYFVGAEQASIEINVTELRFNPHQLGNVISYGGATTIDGVISTRQRAWVTLIGKTPVGEWTFVFPNTQKFREHFTKQRISDILFVVGYSGDTPPWPE